MLPTVDVMVLPSLVKVVTTASVVMAGVLAPALAEAVPEAAPEPVAARKGWSAATVVEPQYLTAKAGKPEKSVPGGHDSVEQSRTP